MDIIEKVHWYDLPPEYGKRCADYQRFCLGETLEVYDKPDFERLMIDDYVAGPLLLDWGYDAKN